VDYKKGDQVGSPRKAGPQRRKGSNGPKVLTRPKNGANPPHHPQGGEREKKKVKPLTRRGYWCHQSKKQEKAKGDSPETTERPQEKRNVHTKHTTK